MCPIADGHGRCVHRHRYASALAERRLAIFALRINAAGVTRVGRATRCDVEDVTKVTSSWRSKPRSMRRAVERAAWFSVRCHREPCVPTATGVTAAVPHPAMNCRWVAPIRVYHVCKPASDRRTNVPCETSTAGHPLLLLAFGFMLQMSPAARQNSPWIVWTLSVGALGRGQLLVDTIAVCPPSRLLVGGKLPHLLHEPVMHERHAVADRAGLMSLRHGGSSERNIWWKRDHTAAARLDAGGTSTAGPGSAGSAGMQARAGRRSRGSGRERRCQARTRHFKVCSTMPLAPTSSYCNDSGTPRVRPRAM